LISSIQLELLRNTTTTNFETVRLRFLRDLKSFDYSLQPPVSAPFEAYLILAFRPTTLLPSPPDLSSTLVFYGKLIKAGVKSMAITFGSLDIIPPQPFLPTSRSHWAQQVLGQNLLVGLASHLDIGLSRALPVSTRSIQRSLLQTTAAVPRVLRPNYALASAFFFPTNLVTTPSTT
jgi:hypothetical protein